jgi:hypothetical protein
MAVEDILFIHSPKTGGSSIRKALGMAGISNHQSAEYFRQKLGPRKFSELVKFTVVRNPYDRLVSYWSYRRRSRETFDHFSRAMSKGASGIMAPQFGRVSINGELVVDYVLRFENLAQDWADFSSKFSLNSNLGHENVGKHGPWTEFYSDELKGLIYPVYRIDFERFGYER